MYVVFTDLQTYTCRCKVLEQEVVSLKCVLELRVGELQDLRRQCAVAEEDAKQLPAVLKTNSSLKLQIECLQAQLEKKSANEQYVFIHRMLFIHVNQIYYT